MLYLTDDIRKNYQKLFDEYFDESSYYNMLKRTKPSEAREYCISKLVPQISIFTNSPLSHFGSQLIRIKDMFEALKNQKYVFLKIFKDHNELRRYILTPNKTYTDSIKSKLEEEFDIHNIIIFDNFANNVHVIAACFFDNEEEALLFKMKC